MHDISLEVVQTELLRRELEDNFFKFCLWVFSKIYHKKFSINWHHRKLCLIMEKVYSLELTRVVINMPPRYSKTEIVIILFIAWCFAKDGECAFLHASYSNTLASKNSTSVQRIVKNELFQKIWPTQINKEEHGKTLWSLKSGGSVYAVNSGGAVTGFGAGITAQKKFKGALLIDDPMKPDDDKFELKRKTINTNFDETMVSRINSKDTPIIIIMQRLHEEDLAGHVLNGRSTAGKFTHFSFPALKESEPSKIDPRKEGEALWPLKHSIKQLEEIKKNNPKYFAGQMEQRPAPEEGLIWKKSWIRRYSVMPESFNVGTYISVDLNMTEGGGSNAVMSKYGVNDGSIFLIDQLVGKWGFVDAEKRLKHFTRPLKESHGPYTGIAIEAHANGHAMISSLVSQGHYGIIPIKVDRSKEYRLNEVSLLYNAGNIYYPESIIAPWIEMHIAEMSVFPNGKNDDRVDAETQFLKFYQTCLAVTYERRPEY